MSDQAVELVHYLAWPGVALIALAVFARPLYVLVDNADKLSISREGLVLQRRKRVEASLTAAVATSAYSSELAAGGKRGSTPAITAEVKAIVNEESVSQLAGSRVLWVDDHPSNNMYLRRAFEDLGVSVDIALSTEDALDQIKRTKFGAIISDMGRPPDPRAGYTLLDKLRQSGDQTPFLIFAGSNLPEHRDMAVQHGALGSTNRPQEVFRVITDILRAGKR